MAQSDVRSFTEPGDFAAAIQGADVELCVLARGAFLANMTRMELNDLKLHRFSESRPRVMHAAINHDRAVISFQTGPCAEIFRNGLEQSPNSIVRLARRQSYFERSMGPVNWGSLSIPTDTIRWAGITGAGCDLTPLLTELTVATAPAAIAKLQRLHAAAGLLAESAPELIERPEPRRCLEQVLIEALVGCFSTGDAAEDRSTQRRHGKIMRAFHAILCADAESPHYVLEIARQIGVSERTLSTCCWEHLGMGPKKYLLLRRMHLARASMFAANQAETTVTDIATQYGFWQLGRFSVEYKYLFGESPSTTLHRKRS